MRETGAAGMERKREVMSATEWRATYVGMWAWVLQRFSALLVIAFVTLHFCYPYQVLFQILLLAAATTHAVLGLRVIVLDLSSRTSLQKLLFWGLAGVGIAGFMVVLKWRGLY